MKILVLNGSPKGDISVTMQYVKYMQKTASQHEFKIINISQGIHQIEKNSERFDEIVEEVRSADGVLWAFPLYVCLPHANYMRFIELIGEREAQSAFGGKYAAVLTTSIHFFDHTAHNYMRAVCDDLGMNYTGFFSAEMNDLLDATQRRNLEFFTRRFLSHIEQHLPTQKLYAPVRSDAFQYRPGAEAAKADSSGLNVLLITASAQHGNLGAMTSRVTNAFTAAVEVVDLDAANIKGGCLGCLKCGFDNECIYGRSDDIFELYNTKIKNADIILFADGMHGRFLSSRFKLFMDRRFLNTHQPQMVGKQIAYILSGPVGQNQNAVEVLQAMAEIDGANLAGIVADECGDCASLDAQLDSLASGIVEMSRAKYNRPITFLGVGGNKLFRDEIYGSLRFAFQGDHRYYKKHRLYDFPQKNIRMRMQRSVMILMSKIPKVKKYMRTNMTTLMLTDYKKFVDGPKATK
jgi:multimeric flavodoxin WrbA